MAYVVLKMAKQRGASPGSNAKKDLWSLSVPVAVVASGNVAERPLPHTIYAIAAKRFTGQLTLVQGGRTYDVGWRQGYAVCARSSDPGDTVGRIALTAGLVSSTQLGMALRTHRDQPERPLIEILAEAAALTDDHQRALTTKAFAQAAVRPFALHEATFTLDDELSVPVADGTGPIDPRWLIFHGLRTQYGTEHLRKELAPVATHTLTLTNAKDPGIQAFGLDDASTRLVHALQQSPRSIDELVAMEPRVPEATPLALAYALLVTKYATTAAADTAVTPPSGSVPSVPAVAPPAAPEVLDDATRQSSGSRPGVKLPSTEQRRAASRARRVTMPRSQTADPQALDGVRNLINEKLALIEGKANHFEVFGVGPTATDDQVRMSYFGLARRLHPDRLRAIGLEDMAKEAHAVFARVNQAFAILSNKTKRAQYIADLESGTTKESEAEVEAMAKKIFGAEHAFQQGLMDLRRRRFAEAITGFTEAVELNPEEGEHHAMLGWAEWCGSDDKEGQYRAIKKRFDRAIALSPKCVPAWFYRGQVSKQREKMEAARECFSKVLQLDKNHKEAQLELRILDRRAEEEAKPKKGGLFDRLKRR